MPLLTITANPSLDRLMLVPGFGTNGVFRETQRLLHAGGKGVNVARAARVLGVDVMCTGLLGGTDGERLAAFVSQEGIPARWTRISGETRTCTIIVNPGTRENAVINERGPEITASDWDHLVAEVLAQSHGSVICLAGSVPPGTPPGAYTYLLESLLTAQCDVWVDASGDLLRQAVQYPGLSLKVNHDEFGELLGRALSVPEDLLAAASEVRSLTRGLVVVTFGAAGAVWVDHDRCIVARPPSVDALCVVGSGDSFLAGLIASVMQQLSPAEALRSACAAGAANTLSLGPASFRLTDYAAIRDSVDVSVL